MSAMFMRAFLLELLPLLLKPQRKEFESAAIVKDDTSALKEAAAITIAPGVYLAINALAFTTVDKKIVRLAKIV
jgi:hypothetical protein